MKWCFLLNQIDNLFEFLGKISKEAILNGDECIIVANSKIAELSKRNNFPKNVKIFSKVDWLLENYKKNQNDFGNFSWKELFPSFVRKHKFLKFNYNNSVQFMSQLYQFMDFVFQTEKPDLVINEIPANLFTETAYYFSKKYNITYFGILGSRINNRVDIYDLRHTYSKYKETFQEIKKNGLTKDEKKLATNFLEGFLSHKELPPYIKNQNKNIKLNVAKKTKIYIKEQKKMLKIWLKYLLKRRKIKYYDYESEALLKWNFYRPLRFLRNKFRKILVNRYFEKIDKNEENIFFLFPLHLQPEASTSVSATYFYDQVNTIRNVAFSLPFPYKLYVKEHPTALGTKPISFYKKIKKIPNVTLISHYENVKDLIEKSQGVITLTSTIGIESALSGKLAYILGNVFYDYHPLCQKIENFEELRQKILKNRKGLIVQNLADINAYFIASYYKNTLKADLAKAVSKNDTNNYKLIYEKIKEIFSKKTGDMSSLQKEREF